MTKKTHWRKILESDYLAGADLDDGKGKFTDIIVTITKAGDEKIREVGTNKEETVLVLYFKESKKPMICNKTNAATIEKLAGSAYTEDWTGLQIQIGTEKVKAFGEVWDALRVRSYVRQTAPTAPDCADCHKQIPAHQGVPGHTIAATTNQKYGRPLCYACAQIVKAETEAIPAELIQEEIKEV